MRWTVVAALVVALGVVPAAARAGASPELDPASAMATDEVETETTQHAEGPEPINFFKIHYGKNVEGGPLKEGQEPMPPPLAFMLLNFAIFAGLLIWKAGPPLRRYLHQRHTELKEALEEAAQLREQARDKLEEYKKRLERADAEMDKLAAEIRTEAEAEKKRILEQSEARAEAIRRDAQARIEAEIARARAALEQEVVLAAIERAEKILREKASPADQAGLVDSFIRDLTPKSDGDSGSVDEEWT